MRTPNINPTAKDVILSGGDFEMVRGRDKLKLDLRAVLVEAYDSDPYVRGYGSKISNMIGEAGTATAIEGQLRVETIDALQRHQRNLINRLQRERGMGSDRIEDFLSADSEMSESMIKTIDSIDVKVQGTVAYVSVTCTTFALQTTTFNDLLMVNF